MKTILAILGFAAVSVVAHAANPAPSPPDPAAVIAHAKAVMALKLKDPDSAHYIDLTVNKGTVCGWVNAKNSFGGYVGYKPFFVVGSDAEIRDDDAPDGTFNNRFWFADEWYDCHPEARTKLGDALVKLPNINIERQCAKLGKYLKDPMPSDRCQQAEINAKAWLASHSTSDSIADLCSMKLREDESYTSGQTCVVEQESDIVFMMGPPTSGI